MSAADEFLHQVKHAAGQQGEQYRPAVYGHIASYDPATHRVKLVVPSLGDGDGNYVLTGWMPLGTIAAGNGWGVQIAPMGGATIETPTNGEKCKITIMERNYGVTVCAEMTFDQVYKPPFPGLQPGEIAVQANSGSFVYFKADGSLNLDTSKANGAINFNAGSGQVNLTTTGKTVVSSTTEVDVTAPAINLGNGGALLPIMLQGSVDSTVVKAQ